ncbi:chromosome segregation protein SMC [soil metagenome]
MYLRRLELHGFKSFARKTSFGFSPGITAIVGPNGCGKSNVIDAVRWVLGEQRARLLRSDKMESVIFNGTSSKRALGMAEVSLTIDNDRGVLPTEYAEVTVARRLFRSGESEYLLNNSPCRLKDILDLFMDTGLGSGAYSVIELKMIEDILSETAADRRRLFEEAAGVTKYKLRRRQALQKLEATQADLTRLRDLADEVDRQVRSLERQAKKAERYQRIAKELRVLELALAARDYDALALAEREGEGERNNAQKEVTRLTTQLDQFEASAEAQRTAVIHAETSRSDAAAAVAAHAEARRERVAERRLAEERRDNARRGLERLAREAESEAARSTNLTAGLERLGERLAAATKQVQEHQEREDVARTERDAATTAADAARGALGAAREEGRRLTASRADAGAALDRLRDRYSMLEAERTRHEEGHASLQESVQAAATRAEQADAALKSAVQSFEDAEARFVASREARAKAEEAVEEARQALRDAERPRDQILAEVELLRSLVNSYEDASSAVGFLAREGALGDDPQTVADVLACDESIKPALVAALGEAAAWLVVPTGDHVHRAAARLRAAGEGRATFLVLDRLSSAPTTSRVNGAQVLVDLVDAEAGTEKAASALLRNCYLVDSLEAAQAAAANGDGRRFFTRDGEWAGGPGATHAGGASGGLRPEAARLGRRAQLRDVESALAEAEQRLARSREALDAAVAGRDRIDIDQARAVREMAQRSLNEAQRVAATAAAEAGAGRTRLADFDRRSEALTTQRAELGSVAELEAAASQAAQLAADAETTLLAAEDLFREAEVAARTTVDRFNEVRLATVRAQNDAAALEGERRRTADEIAAAEGRATARTAEQESLAGHAATAEDLIASLTEELDSDLEAASSLSEALQSAESALLTTRALLSDTEEQLRRVRRAREEAQQQAGRAEVRLAEVAARREGLLERIRDDHGVDVSEIEIEEPEGFDPAEARREVPRLREQIRGLGAVNALALESYEEETERLAFLRGQQADLESAENTLVTTIGEINRTAAERFLTTFEQVRVQFQNLFRTLFGDDAAADLVLEGDDPLEAPIEISARPKGKKPSTIAQLSGGEKTLTAIALLFAIYLVKPSPFCILDEVDAPLDDANVGRFMSLIRSFAGQTQFILVTHNKLTMEAADRMYGVTMQEPGVSQLVGVRFGDVLTGEALPEAA